jgi:Ni/Co efflux regulator RcnB
MMRSMRILVAALIVAFSAASIAEAAPAKTIRHRQKHSSRVSAGASASGTNATGAHKKSTHKKSSGSHSTAKKSGTTRKSAKHQPPTKPH